MGVRAVLGGFWWFLLVFGGFLVVFGGFLVVAPADVFLPPVVWFGPFCLVKGTSL